MEQASIDKKIENNVMRKAFKEATQRLIKSGALPKEYPNHKNKKPYEILRSELDAYKEKHNRDFDLPVGSIIIDDIPA